MIPFNFFLMLMLLYKSDFRKDMATESIRLMKRGVKGAIMFKTLMVRGYIYNLCLI